ncbi:GNAT family N-acetyltransferase [Bacillus suaedae]|uniref:GNAT family N-acetyltransferase n=1 Tax=Halalkalibacter suaedae TaxID=2822140 RepID=UPI003211AD98
MIAYEENNPVGMVRFQLNKEGLYFYRMSVIPEHQGKGIAKKLLYSLENYAIESRVSTLLCKVRMTVSKNMKLYSSLGYRVYDEEEVYKPNGIVLRIVSMQKEV